MVGVIQAGVLGTGIALALFYVVLLPLGSPGTAGVPRSFWLIEMLVALAFQGSLRFGLRLLADHRASRAAAEASVGATAQPVLLFGAGRIGALIARSALRDPGAGVRPVGFLDDDARLRGQSIADIPVLGDLTHLAQAVSLTGARALLITMAAARGERVREIVEAATSRGLEVRTVPPMHELLAGSIDAYRVRDVCVEDLLSRPVSAEHAPGVASMIGGSCVMITGAGGSIGSEIARQVYALNPARLVLVDRAESPLYMVQRELEVRHVQGLGSGEIVTYLGNVASPAAMRELVNRHRPGTILHAAAYKHVPMMEAFPSEAVHVNIGGTISMLEAAWSAGVERFVLVSTDKAVEPSSVMGATKRVAETLVAEVAKLSGLSYVSVRFGNVLGSAGSVLPIFTEQIERGQPLTITHPDMTRYFMTISEAAWLILDAASIGTPGDLFVLDMGNPVRIMDLARDLIRLSGRPAGSVPIQITGLRPGEKLNEQLFYRSEEVVPTSVPKIRRAVAFQHPFGIREAARDLLGLATGTDDRSLYHRLFAMTGQLEAAPNADHGRSPGALRPVMDLPAGSDWAPDRRGASRVRSGEPQTPVTP